MLLEVETVHELEGAWWAFALKAARRASVSALCCAMRRRFSSGVTLVSPRGCRVNGLLFFEVDMERGASFVSGPA